MPSTINCVMQLNGIINPVDDDLNLFQKWFCHITFVMVIDELRHFLSMRKPYNEYLHFFDIFPQPKWLIGLITQFYNERFTIYCIR